MIERLSNRERFKDVSHFDQIVENGTTHIDSVFMFKSPNDLFPFMYACQNMNSTVIFENEDITISPDDKDKTLRDFILILYCTIAEHPEIVQQYLSYLLKEHEKEYRRG